MEVTRLQEHCSHYCGFAKQEIPQLQALGPEAMDHSLRVELALLVAVYPELVQSTPVPAVEDMVALVLYLPEEVIE